MSRILLTLFLIFVSTSLMADPLIPYWSRTFGDNLPDVLTALDTGPEDQIIVTGNFQGGMNFGAEQIVSQGEYDIFLAALSQSGHVLWYTSFGDINNDKVRDLVVDSAGNIIIVGDFFGSMDFGGGLFTSAGDKDAFVAKFDANGNHLWSAVFGDSNYQSAQCVTVSPENNVVLAGQFTGVINLGGQEFSSMDQQELFLVTFDPDGSHLWSRAMMGAGDQWVHDIHLESSDWLYVVGSFEGWMDIGGDAIFSFAGLDAFLILYTPSTGVLNWGGAYGNTGDQEARSVGCSETGNPVIAGDFENGILLGDVTLYNNGGRDLFLASLTNESDFLWAQGFGSSDDQYAENVAVGDYGEIAFTGFARGSLDFGGGSIYSAGSFDVFLATFDSEGQHRSSGLYGDSGEQRGIDLAWNSNQQLNLGAWFFSTIEFWPGFHSSYGNADIALAQFESDPSSSPTSPQHLSLSAWPNPFNPSTEIVFHLESSSWVEVDIYNTTGRQLHKLQSRTLLEAGEHRIPWKGLDDRGEALPSGVYLCKLMTDSTLSTRKLVLLK